MKGSMHSVLSSSALLNPCRAEHQGGTLQKYPEIVLKSSVQNQGRLFLVLVSDKYNKKPDPQQSTDFSFVPLDLKARDAHPSNFIVTSVCSREETIAKVDAAGYNYRCANRSTSGGGGTLLLSCCSFRVRPESASSIQQLASKTGLAPEEISSHHTEILPKLVDKLTPNGQVPQGDIISKGLDILKGMLK